jgi:hypothetical protein
MRVIDDFFDALRHADMLLGDESGETNVICRPTTAKALWMLTPDQRTQIVRHVQGLANFVYF